MGEISFLIRKAIADKEKEQREWQIAQLDSHITHAQHELKVIKELGLEQSKVQYKLNEYLVKYRELTGRDYSC